MATEGQLQIQGTLTEYDLANIKTGQTVKIKSKVYPDQEWTGTISYVSNYPNQTSDTASAASASSDSTASSTYDYKVDINGDISNLKQGFTVSVEVVNDTKNKLVPVKAVITEGEKNYVWVYDKDTQKVSKVEVTLGSADAKEQEILSGLEVGQTVIANPNDRLKDGETVDDVVADNATVSDESGESE